MRYMWSSERSVVDWSPSIRFVSSYVRIKSPTATTSTTPNVFERAATEAYKLTAYNKKSTASSRERICELKVCLRGEQVMLAIRALNARNGYSLTTL